MFRQLAFRLSNPASTPPDAGRDAVLDKHPLELAALLEAAYELGRDLKPEPASDPGSPADTPTTRQEPLGHPNHRSDVKPIVEPAFPNSFGAAAIRRAALEVRWDHLIYAYMIENTRIYEIFRRVLYEFLHGEKIGTPLAESQNWLRTTEELFYRDPAPFLITSVASHIRPDLGSNRRNAYQRMFGMDLNHGGADGKPYPYVKAEAANNEFVATFEEFLREVWVAITYVTATSSSNPKDDSKIAELAEKLHDMLRSRRQNGNLSREEFAFVSMMSWFHMTLEFDSPIVRSLRAEATGMEQRLFKIAERVGLPAHGLSKNFFDIADDISYLLIEIEKGAFNKEVAVEALYTRVTGSLLEPAMRNIITHWSAITGHDIKSRKVAPN
jgi:transcriptional regulator with XRE-family HTH domain